MPLGQTSASEILAERLGAVAVEVEGDDVVDRCCGIWAAAESSSVPSIIDADSRYLWATLVSASHSQVTSGFFGSSSTLTGVPSCGQVKAL